MNKPFEFIVIAFIREFIVFISHSTVLVYSLRHFFFPLFSIAPSSEKEASDTNYYTEAVQWRAEKSKSRLLGPLDRLLRRRPIASMIEKLISSEQMPGRNIGILIYWKKRHGEVEKIVSAVSIKIIISVSLALAWAGRWD